MLEVLSLDVIVNGRLRDVASRDGGLIGLAVEVSAVIDRNDVERAVQRANLMRKASLLAVPVVAGDGVSPDATQLLHEAPVLLMLDGRSEGWDCALSAAIAE